MNKGTLGLLVCLFICVGAWATNYLAAQKADESLGRLEWRVTGIELREVRPTLSFEASWTDKRGLKHTITVAPAAGQTPEAAIAELASDVEAALAVFPKE